MNRKFNQGQLNAASANLKTALNKIANQHVLKYANDIRKSAKAQANAARAAANAAAAPTETNVAKAAEATRAAAAAHNNMIKSENAAAAVVSTVPISEQVPVATQIAANQANNSVIALIKNIATYNTINKLTNVKKNQRYINATNKARINKAVNNKRANLLRQTPPPP